MIYQDSDFREERFWFGTPGAFEKNIVKSLSDKSEYMYIVKVLLDDWREIWDIRKFVAKNDKVLKKKLDKKLLDYEIISKIKIDDSIIRIN